MRWETLRKGLMTTPLGTRTLLLHTHPDGARLAHGPNIGGISPGLYVELGDYAIQVLMLAPHGKSRNVSCYLPGSPLY